MDLNGYKIVLLQQWLVIVESLVAPVEPNTELSGT